MKRLLTGLLSIVLIAALLGGCSVVQVHVCPPEENGQSTGESTPDNNTDTPVTSGSVKTGLAVITSLDGSAGVSAEAAGSASFDVTLAAVTVDDAGVIDACVIDGVKATVNFDNTGTITSDLTAPVLSKNELGEDYGMKAYGGAIAEWDEQAAAFAAYVTGKTLDEVSGIAVNERTQPTDADLAASVTIAVGGFMSLIAKAAQ